jgi:hypothetical protein
MPRTTTELTQALAQSAWSYDKDTGLFRWRAHKQGHAKAGQVAGSIGTNGYWYVFLSGRRYCAHRVAWLHVYGSWPEHEIDHINGDRLDNSIANLRDIPRGINHQNKRRAYSTSSTGLLGVLRNGKRFAARIQVDKRRVNLGNYATAEEAHAAYLKAKRRLHPGSTL